ncbi:MAG: hypothetical protein WA667_08145 [Candidatus Nitrosopolaris sp.]
MPQTIDIVFVRDIFRLKDESLEDSENLPAPDIITKEIAENLESRWNNLVISVKI